MKITANKKAIIEQNVKYILENVDTTYGQDMSIAKEKLVAYIVSLLEAKK